MPELEPERLFPAKYQVTVLFDPSCRWRLVEEYGTDSFTPTPDGRLRFVGTFPDEDSILSWLLTFGDGAELLEPPEEDPPVPELAVEVSGGVRPAAPASKTSASGSAVSFVSGDRIGISETLTGRSNVLFSYNGSA